jgi:hypothetical protein
MFTKIDGMKGLCLAFFACVCSLTGYCQESAGDTASRRPSILNYAYIRVEGKAFSKKLAVKVDLGDKLDEIELGKEYSDMLNNKKSYAAILNYMSEKGFELVETHEISYSYAGTGETYGVILIMRRSALK